jgi:hypothetical protein
VGDNIDNTRIIKNKKTLIDVSMKVGLEANAEKTKYMLLARNQNAGKNHDIETVHRSFQKWHRSDI